MPPWGPPPLPARLAASRHVPLVGRRSELETLEAVWAQVEEGRRQVVFVGGDPGAGKTRLVAEVATALHDHDIAVLVGASSSDAGVPYEPFSEMLHHLFTSTPEGSLADFVDDGAAELRRLSSAVARHAPDLGDTRVADGEVRRELFEAVARLFRRVADERPLALVVDDLHWAQLPTLALFEHVVRANADSRLLVLATFRTTAPDRSDETAARIADLHRLEGVRRLDLGGLDTEAIAEYVQLRSGVSHQAAQAPAALLRDLTGGNPFFLRELWLDLEHRGGVSALRSFQGVPASIGDTLATRLGSLDDEVRHIIELAAVLGDTFDLGTLVLASEVDRDASMAHLDAAVAVGLVELVADHGDRYSFVHALTRSAVLDRMPASRRIELHARAAQVLDRQPHHASLVPRLAHHYFEAHVLGFHEPALRYSREAGELAERSLAFEEAALWFERAAELPDCDPAVRSDLLLAAAFDRVRACDFPRARAIYERLATAGPLSVRLAAAMGFEDASWRPGSPDVRAVDLLSAALEESGIEKRDPRYIRGLASLGRALAMAGDTRRAREVGSQAIDLARELDDAATVSHALSTSLWSGISPDVADLQLARTAEVSRMAKEAGDFETLGAAANFRSMVTYLCGRPDGFEEALADSGHSARSTGQPYYRYVYCCLAQADAFRQGDFARAERWASETLEEHDTFGDDMTEGPYGVQMFMIRRETGALERFRPYLDGTEAFDGRWVPGLLALYTELGIQSGMRRALQHLMARDRVAHPDDAQWPMELVFMLEAALALEDADAVRHLRPFVAEYEERNLVSGTLIAIFGSADRLLGRAAAFLGDHAAAERHFETALAMDQRMRSIVHTAETLAHFAVFLTSTGRREQGRGRARAARELAEPIGQRRVTRMLDALEQPPEGPDGLTGREVDVLRLLSTGLSNREIGEHLHISANTAANHVRSILMKTGAANRTQAATYAVRHELV